MSKTEYATGDVYKVLGQISEAQRLARPELGELPMTYITHRKKPVMAVVPAWVADWVYAHATELLEQRAAEQRTARD